MLKSFFSRFTKNHEKYQALARMLHVRQKQNKPLPRPLSTSSQHTQTSIARAPPALVTTEGRTSTPNSSATKVGAVFSSLHTHPTPSLRSLSRPSTSQSSSPLYTAGLLRPHSLNFQHVHLHLLSQTFSNERNHQRFVEILR
ncbi:Hypothetical protein, putative [Bodo saltans]|uniref:Uncharacterized protein n=1 Tax=Bodo saltans TaxID=75058 RepID=A0A0S4IL98_BODSA|nr:Hypothetical protein, putative [Bodo saltans]|eukprot:CUF23695.1 Hypothetical protein, putative [Bodo saltans]